MASQERAAGLDEEGRRIIHEALEQLALGDAEGRRIFLLALGYELEGLLPEIRQALAEREQAPERTQSPRLRQLEHNAEALRASLAGLEPDESMAVQSRMTSQGRLGHGYGEDYFAILSTELGRLAAACAAEQSPPRLAYTDITALRLLVALLAKAYAECFESEPESSVDGSFARVIATIFVKADIRAPVTRNLIRKGLETRRALEG